MNKILKIILISLGSLLLLAAIAIGAVLWYVFTPERLTPVVRQQAEKYINGEVEIGRIETTFFSTFPHFGIRIDGVRLINPVTEYPDEALLEIKEAVASIDFGAFCKNNELLITELTLIDGKAFAYIDSTGKANFDILPPDLSTTETKGELPFSRIDAGNINLKNVSLFFVDRQSKMTAKADGLSAILKATMRGDVIDVQLQAQPFPVLFTMENDSVSSTRVLITDFAPDLKGVISGKAAEAELSARPFRLIFALEGAPESAVAVSVEGLSPVIKGKTDGDRIDVGIRLLPFALTADYAGDRYLNNAQAAFDLQAQVNMAHPDAFIQNGALTLNKLPLSFNGKVAFDTVSGDITTDLAYRLQDWQLRDVLAMAPPAFSTYLKGITADGKVTVDGTAKGIYGKTSMPELDLQLLLAEGSLRYSELPVPLHAVRGDIHIHTDLNMVDDRGTTVRINGFSARTPNSSLQARGTVTRPFTNPRINLTANVDADLAEFAPVVPKEMKVDMKGRVDGKLQADVQKSQIEQMALDKMKISGDLAFSKLDVTYDTIHIKSSTAQVEFALPNPSPVLSGRKFLKAKVAADRFEASMPETTAMLAGVKLDIETSDVRDTTHIPSLLCIYAFDRLEAQMDTIAVHAVATSGQVAAASQSLGASAPPQFNLLLKSDLLNAKMGAGRLNTGEIDINTTVTYDETQKDLYLKFAPYGHLRAANIQVKASNLPSPVEVPQLQMDFTQKEFNIEKAQIRFEKSDFGLEGKLHNLRSYFEGDSILRGEFNFTSSLTDINRLMELTNGLGSELQETAPVDTKAGSGPYMVPTGIDITLHTDIKKALFGNETLSNISGDLQVRNGLLVLGELTLSSPAAEMQLTAMYRTPRKNHLFAGIDFHLMKIEISDLIKMIPEIDSIMPMLRSFGGTGEFHFTAETYLDSLYNLKMSTLRGVASIRGDNLVLMDGETFSEIAKKLRFNKKTENKIDSLSTEFTIFRNEVDIYPFLIVMDKYKAVVAGRHNLDMSFDYNISLVESPLPFRIAVDVRGTIDKLKFRLARSKYPEFYRPSSRRVVESRQRELRDMIQQSLLKRVNKAVDE